MNPPDNTPNNTPNYASLVNATNTSIPVLPEWLVVGSSVYSPEFGEGEVTGSLGCRLFIRFDSKSEIVTILNWIEAVKQQLLIKASDAPTRDPLPELEQINHPLCREVAYEFSESLVAVDVMPPTPPELHPLPDNLPPFLLKALQRNGITHLYSHQLEALNALRQGLDICLVTNTASGKTLSFSIPILESCLKDSSKCVLLLYPLKALAIDQMSKLEALNAALPLDSQLKIGLITGDTPFSERKKLFNGEPPQILGMSPDLLHYQLYSVRTPDGEPFRQFLRRLAYVVVDESHTYLAAFGANVTNLFRRLRAAVDRVSGNSDRMQWVFASATIGNPEEMALRLSGREKTLERLVTIDKSGAGSAGRTLLHLKPSSSANPDAAKIILSLLDKDLSGICFCNSRSAVKSLLFLIRAEATRQGVPNLADSVAVFYGSLKSDRRFDIIHQLQSGRVRFILSTCALEAGLDLPELDVCLIRGWPGSLMSFRQRIGRAGRRNPGLAIFLPVAQNLLDNYYSANPSLLLQGIAETASMNPDYPVILGKHIMAAAVESGIPLHRLSKYFGERGAVVASALMEQGQLFLSRHGQLWGRGYPHREISLRGNRSQIVQLVNASTGEEFEEMSLDMAQREVFAGAIYTAQSESGEITKFKSTSLDEVALRATLTPISGVDNTFTIASTELDIKLLEPFVEPKTVPLSIPNGQIILTLGWGAIASSVTSYKLCVKQYAPTCVNRSCRNYHQPLTGKSCSPCGQRLKSMELIQVIDEVEFDKPLQTQYKTPIVKVEMNAHALKAMIEWVTSLKEQVRDSHDVIPSIYTPLWESSPELIALHSMGHQLIFSIPLLVLCSMQDVNFVAFRESGGDTVGYFYDSVTDGNGASEAVYHQFGQLSQKAYSLSKGCDCEAGCAKCLHLHGCPQTNYSALNKQIGMSVLDAINCANQDSRTANSTTD